MTCSARAITTAALMALGIGLVACTGPEGAPGGFSLDASRAGDRGLLASLAPSMPPSPVPSFFPSPTPVPTPTPKPTLRPTPKPKYPPFINMTLIDRQLVQQRDAVVATFRRSQAQVIRSYPRVPTVYYGYFTEGVDAVIAQYILDADAVRATVATTVYPSLTVLKNTQSQAQRDMLFAQRTAQTTFDGHRSGLGAAYNVFVIRRFPTPAP